MERFTVDNKNVAIYMLGLTGNGKSTTINYLLGAKGLKWQRNKTQIHITNENTTDYPVIGNTVACCTNIPSSYLDPRGGIEYIDSAGFMDPKGDEQEIINAYANARMFKRGTRAKIILVIEYSSLIFGRGGNLLEIAQRLLEFFPRDYSTLINSVMIMVTKVNTDEYEFSDFL